MNQLRKVCGYGAGVFAILSLVMGLAGCQSSHEFIEDLPGLPHPKGATNAPGGNPTGAGGGVFHVGDAVIITFSGMEPPIPMHQEIIKENGTITPPELGGKSIVAAGKSSTQLQEELLVEYQKIYRRPVINVNPAPRFYYVTGDVLHSGAQQYLGETTLVQAIAAASGLTEFAKKSDIQITRAGTRKVIHVNYRRALEGDAKHNVRIQPGDTIFVPRSAF